MATHQIIQFYLSLGLSLVVTQVNSQETNTATSDFGANLTAVPTHPTNPLMQHSFTGPFITKNDINYITEQTLIHLSATSSENTDSDLTYRIDDQNERPYNEAFHIKEQGSHVVLFRARSNNSVLAEKSVTVFNDTEGPGISVNFSYKSIKLGNFIVSSTSDQNLKTRKKYPFGTTVALIAEDDHVDVSQLTYQLDDSEEISYKDPILLPKGKHLLTIRASDSLGNETNMNRLQFEIILQ